MEKSPQTFLLVLVMVLSGTINTVLIKFQDNVEVSKTTSFQQPIWQLINMFLGEAICLVFYFSREIISKPAIETIPLLSHSYQPYKGKDLSIDRNEFVFLSCALLDVFGTTFLNVGLIFIPTSIFQMLSGSVVIFTGLISILYLGKSYPPYRWFALVLVCLGVGIVGLSSYFFDKSIESPINNKFGFGFMLVLLGQLNVAVQFVMEENLIQKFKISPIKVVGLEGCFGLLILSLILPLTYMTFGIDPHGLFHTEYFDIPKGYRQIIDSNELYFSFITIIFTTAIFTASGVAVTSLISSTSRSVVDTMRTIWAVCLVLGWEQFNFVQVIGFSILMIGTLMWNDVFCTLPSIKKVEEVSII